MTLSPLEAAYQRYDEPVQASLLAVRDILLKAEPQLIESLKYGMPFFSYRAKICCYLWVDKKREWPYIGWVDGVLMQHPMLESGARKRIKIQWLNPSADLPFEDITTILELAKATIDEKLEK